MSSSKPAAVPGSLIEDLRRAVGAEHVFADQDRRILHSVDFSEIRLATAAVVVRPASTEETVTVVQLARAAGMSYTLGYVPQREPTVLLSMERMNRIERIDTEDLYVTVEAGVTWAQLTEALARTDYHVPFMGTLSGIRATVGGGLGNNATGVGSGDISDHLLGVQVVLSDGRVLETGGRATGAPAPLLRNFGPDLTGLFVHDCGALGIKTRASFRLAKRPGGVAVASFGFRDPQRGLRAFTEIIREGIASELFVFGAFHHRQFAGQPKPAADEAKRMLGKVFRLNRSRVRGALDVARILAANGVSYLEDWPQSVHVITTGRDHASAARLAREARRVARSCGGHGISGAFMLALRANPFNPIEKLIMGPSGECSFPSNCVVPLSRGPDLAQALDTFFADNENYMQAHGLQAARLYLQVKGMFGVEPIIYWPDVPNPLRRSILSDAYRQPAGPVPPEDARAAALALRSRLVDVFRRFHGAHFQIGKYYPYRDALTVEACWPVLQSLKDALDPGRLMNPGALGLE